MSRVRAVIDRLSVAESDFLRQEFVAPVVRNEFVHVRLAGTVCRMKVACRSFSGWGIFRPKSFASAKFVREAGLRERARYLHRLPVVRMLLSRRSDQGWLALPAQRGDRRVQVTGEVPVQLVEGALQFSLILCRFDGRNLWFDELDSRHDPAIAGYLRESLEEAVDPQRLHRAGLTPEERAVYALRYFERAEVRERLLRDSVEDRLREALAHAGAEFIDYAEHRDGYRVIYRAGRERHVSSVRKDDLSVQVAGICLNGEDAKFDLHSLVGVLQKSEGNVFRIGDGGMDESDYWRVHPPR